MDGQTRSRGSYRGHSKFRGKTSYQQRSASPAGGGHHGSRTTGHGHAGSYRGGSTRPRGGAPSRGGFDSASAPSYAHGGFRGGSRSHSPVHRSGGNGYAPRGDFRGGSSSRPSRFGGGNRFGGGQRQSNRGPRDENIDVSRFVNKAVITEETPNFVPEHKFSDFAVRDVLKKNISAKGYELPTPIQDRVIPHILRGEDVVGIANTGTGKTGAFLIPLINKILEAKSERILIMVPTRELAIQIEEEFKGFAHNLHLHSVVCVGGVNISRQIMGLRRDFNVIIGTPGRLKDLVERRVLNLALFKTVVLDEADRMLDMGFIKDITELMAMVPVERHTLFFSATLSKDIERLIGSFLKNPARISVKTRETSANIDQDVVRLAGRDRTDVLMELLKQPELQKVMIFGRTKHGVEKLSKKLLTAGFRVASIHGNKNHNKRQLALGEFKRGKIQALIATDVAARGLDIPDVSHVINYEIPATYDDYVHRIGRTGRSGKKGIALTFVG